MEQNGTPEKDTTLALALASGISIADAAAQADVGRTTVYRKLENPEFRRLVAEYRDRLISTALGRITDNMTRAAEALAQMIDSPEPHIRIRAIRTLFSFGMRMRDSIDLNTRMREVELELARKQGVAP